jgi:hypothetical protein
MSAIEFSVAAREQTVQEDEDVVEVPIDGKVYLARRLTMAQSALLNEALNGSGSGRVRATFDLIQGFMGPEALEHIERLIWERRIDFNDLLGGGSEQNPGGGLIDQIIEQFSARPTQPSTASSPSPVSGGRRSTGRSRGKGSVPSAT